MAKQGLFGISWCDFTFSAWWGCTEVSPGCKFCYAKPLAGRFKGDFWGFSSPRMPQSERYWRQIALWQRAARLSIESGGHGPRVFCGSMNDIFEGPETCRHSTYDSVVVPSRARLFEEIENAPDVTFMLLTKRAENMLRFAPAHWADAWPSNVWAMVSAENQTALDSRYGHLCRVPAVVRGISAEPILGPLNFAGMLKPAPITGQMVSQPAGRPVNWIVVGGESGPNARPMHPEWAIDICDQCAESGVAFHLKQWGEWHSIRVGQAITPGAKQGFVNYDGTFDADPYPLNLSFKSGAVAIERVGKRAAGHLLGGQEWHEFPNVKGGDYNG